MSVDIGDHYDEDNPLLDPFEEMKVEDYEEYTDNGNVQPVLYAFMLIRHVDGATELRLLDDPQPPIYQRRTPTFSDVEVTCSDVARDAGREILIERLVKRLTPAPVTVSTPDRVAEALVRRGLIENA